MPLYLMYSGHKNPPLYRGREYYPGHASYWINRSRSSDVAKLDPRPTLAQRQLERELARADAKEVSGNIPEEVMKLFEEWPT